MTIFILILALILAIVAVAFALQNPLIVTATFFTLSMKGSLALFVLIGVGVGIVIGVLAMLPSVLKGALTVSRHRKQINTLEKSLNEQKKTKPDEASDKIKSDETPKS
ncbi:MAG: lipopolysaccharide assembly protein LapA domain-containing protein [Anaerolineales bacterium]